MTKEQVRFTLVVVTSRDGYIAAPGRAVPRDWASAEEQRHFLAMMDGFDWSFMGRRTHEAVWRPTRRRVVFSSSFRAPEWRHPRHLWADPRHVSMQALLDRLRPAREPRHCGILGGVAVHDWFARQGLIDAVELTIEPLDFGRGLPLFTGAEGIDPRASLQRLGLVQTGCVTLNAGGTLLCRFARPGEAG